MKARVIQSCSTLWNTRGYTVHGILQARILEWVAFPSPGVLPNPGIIPRSPTLQVDSLPAEPQGKLKYYLNFYLISWRLDFLLIRDYHASYPGCESEVAQSRPTLCDPMDCSLPGSSIQGSFQVSILEWVAIFFSRRSSWPRDWTRVSCIVGRCFTVWATRETDPGCPEFKIALPR